VSRLRRPLVLILAAALAMAAPAAAQRSCGTAPPSPALLEQIRGVLGDDANGSATGCTGTIVVAFHVLHDGSAGLLSQAQIDAQIQELNANFAPRGYLFTLGQVDFTNNPAWFDLRSYANEIAIKSTLALYPAQTLNIYSCMPYGYLGFSYYPSTFPETSFEHCVFIDYRSLPGGSIAPYDLGRTATHEVGHYLGLLHTFEGGCGGAGDLVADTPDEQTPTFGCPFGKDTCPSVGLDPIQNYMDYSDDACYSEFTAGQGALMCQMVSTYRPSLLASGPTPVRREGWGRLKTRYR